ncbi:hypothetical protein XENOCAPTIV_015455 [Xenoophorus captivus]|uniref:Uncharacterized protein n=1 Tax=Xenoophorus captivus TaxID=1517983 RepID=A0ABV0R0J6_9TELE
MAHSCRWRFPARPGGSSNSGTGRRAGRIRVTAFLRSVSGTQPNAAGLGPGFDAALQVSSVIRSNLQKFRDVLGESSDSSGAEVSPRLSREHGLDSSETPGPVDGPCDVGVCSRQRTTIFLLHDVQHAFIAAGISKGVGRPPPSPPNGTTLGVELVPDPPIHGFIRLQQAGEGLSPLLSELPDWEKGGNCVVFLSLCVAFGWGRGVPRTLSLSPIAMSGRVIFVFYFD